MGRTIGRCLDDTGLRAAQENLLAADDEVDASVSGNDAVPPPIERQSMRCSLRTVSEYTSLSWSRERCESKTCRGWTVRVDLALCVYARGEVLASSEVVAVLG